MDIVFSDKTRKILKTIIYPLLLFIGYLLLGYVSNKEVKDVYKRPQNGNFAIYNLFNDNDLSEHGKIFINRIDNGISVTIKGEEMECLDVIDTPYIYKAFTHFNKNLYRTSFRSGEEYFMYEEGNDVYILINLQDDYFLSINQENLKYATDLYIFLCVNKENYERYPYWSSTIQHALLLEYEKAKYAFYFSTQRVKNEKDWI